MNIFKNNIIKYHMVRYFSGSAGVLNREIGQYILKLRCINFLVGFLFLWVIFLWVVIKLKLFFFCLKNLFTNPYLFNFFSQKSHKFSYITLIFKFKS